MLWSIITEFYTERFSSLFVWRARWHKSVELIQSSRNPQFPFSIISTLNSIWSHQGLKSGLKICSWQPNPTLQRIKSGWNTVIISLFRCFKCIFQQTILNMNASCCAFEDLSNYHLICCLVSTRKSSIFYVRADWCKIFFLKERRVIFKQLLKNIHELGVGLY